MTNASEETTKGLTVAKLKSIDNYPEDQNTKVNGVTWFKEDSYKSSEYNWLCKIFSKATKKQTMRTKGTPDFIITLDDSDIILVIECKGSVEEHTRYNDVKKYIGYGYGSSNEMPHLKYNCSFVRIGCVPVFMTMKLPLGMDFSSSGVSSAAGLPL